MTDTTTLPGDATQASGPSKRGITLVDCDTHPTFAQDWVTELEPYLTNEWREILRAGDLKSRVPSYWPGVRYQLPGNGFYPRRGAPVRLDLVGPNGELPGSDAREAARQHLDRHGVDRAILIPQGVFGIGAFPNPAVAVAIASATNRWMAERWYDIDQRWRGTLAVAPQDPDSAVAEIERWKDHPAFAGVFISIGNILLGHKHFHPIYEAAQAYDLAITLHVTGTEGVYTSGASFAGGLPTHHIDFRYMLQQPYQANVANLVATGVFERFPRLQVVFTEVGFAWLPELLWKMDGFFKTAREETPWLRRPPSAYVYDHITFTSQPFIEPERREYIKQILAMIHAERTLLFSTDYPHWDADDPMQVAKEIPEAMRPSVLAGNALRAYPRLLM